MEQSLIDEIVAARSQAADGARPDAVAAVRQRGQLTARERISVLVDEGSFIEYGVLAEGDPDSPGAAPADGLVGGVATIGGAPAVVMSYDVSVHGGTQSRLNSRKIEKLIFLAHEHRWPFVCFADGDGTRVEARGGAGFFGGTAPFGVFDGLAELSGWAPTVAVIAGRARAGNAALALFCDFIVATTGSNLIAPSPAEGGDDAELPAEQHEKMGDVDLVVSDDAAAAAAVRAYLGYWATDLPSGTPAAGADTIASIIPVNRRQAYDVRNVISAFADQDTVFELRPNWAKSLVTAFARLDGRAVGIFANQPRSSIGGALDSDASDKLSRFVELCDAYEVALVSFIDNPGYMVGPDAERAGIARHHGRPLAALQARTVPLCSVQIRKAYGLGPFAMSGYGANRLVPELRLAWPTVETGGMSLEGAASLVRRKEILAATSQEEINAIREDYARTVRGLTSGIRAGRTYSFDDIVLPEETRNRIASFLKLVPRSLPPEKKHYIDSL
jgi:acetyl-CoA carboxylase carboxyltransferase component